MSQPEHAIIRAEWARVSEDGSVQRTVQTHPVQYNPKELSLEKGVQFGEITIPGLDAPLQQFVRGQAEKLTVELFFDTTEGGMGRDAASVTTQTDHIYKLVKVESDSHAPPIVTFIWNRHFSGDTLTAGSGNQLRNSFTGVVERLQQRFTLFSPEGVPLRATVNMVLREYRTLEEQLNQLRLNSPERTHSHVLQAGEDLSSVAGKYYQRPEDWRHIADANTIEDPRRLVPGTVLSIPALTRGVPS